MFKICQISIHYYLRGMGTHFGFLEGLCPRVKLTLTSLSHPQETMIGLLLFGEKRTQDTHSEWLSSYRSKGRLRGGSPPQITDLYHTSLSGTTALSHVSEAQFLGKQMSWQPDIESYDSPRVYPLLMEHRTRHSSETASGFQQSNSDGMLWSSLLGLACRP